MTQRTGWDVSDGPGVTALGLAAARAVETSRADRLIEDPFARPLFEAAGMDLPMLVQWPDPASPVSDSHALHLHGSRYIGLRTRFYDAAIAGAARAGAAQGVLLGAGLDTRAFRLDMSDGFRLFELDQLGVLEYKNTVLQDLGASCRCQRVCIGVDLRDDWTADLQSHGFDSGRPTAWIAEGLLPYLAPDAQLGFLAAIHELSAPGSVLAFDRIVGDATSGGRLERLSARSGIRMDRLLAGGDAEDLAGFLAGSGWAVEVEPVKALASRYGRDLSDPFGGDDDITAEPPWLETVFVSAVLG
jgi:methyltransferase (TIGR00027 family)